MKRTALLFALIAILAWPIDAAVIFVPGHYPTIQQAINASKNFDTIVVRPGTYAEIIDFQGRAITVRSLKGPDVTTIDGQQWGSVVVFDKGESMGSVLDGFTLTNGSGSPGTYGTLGGAIFCLSTSPTITNNTIIGNAAERGGGICCDTMASPTIDGNRIIGNDATLGWGGGVFSYYDSSPTITNNVIRDNFAYFHGGGLYHYWSSSTISGNVVEGNSTLGGGAGIYFTERSSVTVTDNRIVDNVAAFTAGGIYADGSDGYISRNFISGNVSGSSGGGICNYGSNGTITNNIVVNNTAVEGGGIFFRLSSPIVAHNTVAGNTATTGGGLHVYLKSSPKLYGTILWDNTATTGKEIWLGDRTYPASLVVDCCDIQGGQASVWVDLGCTLSWGADNIDVDPLFADVAREDYHLTWPSLCREGGGNTFIFENKDYDGDPRVVSTFLDIGADEFHPHLYSLGEVIPGNLIALVVAGKPGMPVKLAFGKTLLDPPATTPHGSLWIPVPPAASWQLGNLPGTGFLRKVATVPSAWVSGSEHPFQALVGLWGGADTQLTNLLLLKVK